MSLRPSDVEPLERDVHRLLSAVPPTAPPVGFRDEVMRRIGREARSPLEAIVAVALALPSLAFLIWTAAAHGADVVAALEGAFSTTGTEAGVTFYVDGLVVLAAGALAAAALLGTHAIAATEEGPA